METWAQLLYCWGAAARTPDLHGSHGGVSGVEIIAVPSPTDEHVRAFAERYSIPKWFTDYRDMLSLNELDVVVLGLSNYLHAEATAAAAKAKKHVICEKPLCMNLAEADPTIETRREEGVNSWRGRHDWQDFQAWIIAEGGGGQERNRRARGNVEVQVRGKAEQLPSKPISEGGANHEDIVLGGACGGRRNGRLGEWGRGGETFPGF